MWINNSVFYQIYPIGFCGVSRTNNGETSNKILKIGKWAEHLKKLGTNCVLLNPIFESDNHGYDTRDFTIIDKRLGTNDDFAAVCKTLKQHDIKIVLDGVFNHVGRGFWAFEDVLKNKQNSPYVHWFFINFDGNNNYNDGFWYEGWEGHFELVKLNLKNPQVTEYLFKCIKDWIINFDIDGLRLDVAYSLDFDFMRDLRRICTEIKSDFALIGEVLFGDYNLIVNEQMLHSCTNYECYKGLFSSMNDENMFEIAHSLHRQFSDENWAIYKGKHLMSFVDNHDVSRIYSMLKNKNHLSLTYAMLMGMPGIPCIYYGSEWAQEGDKAQGDDALRPCYDEPQPNELTSEIAKLIEIRKNTKALTDGGYKNIVINNKQLVFMREFDGEKVLIAINISAEEITLHGDLNGNYSNILTGENITLNGSLNMKPYSYLYLK